MHLQKKVLRRKNYFVSFYNTWNEQSSSAVYSTSNERHSRIGKRNILVFCRERKS